MPKAATGAYRWVNGIAIARITIRGRVRSSFEMPHARTEEAASERARILATAARRLRQANMNSKQTIAMLRAVAATPPREISAALADIEGLLGGKLDLAEAETLPTFQQIGDDWTSGELARRHPDHIKVKRSAADDEARFKRYVYPVLGAKPIDKVTLDDCQAVMRGLPADREVLTRRQIGQLMSRVMNLAVYPLQLIKASPIPRGFLPQPPKRKALGYLYPDEDARLLACTAVPLEYRVLWGFLDREGMRSGEALALTWSELDLHRGAVRLDKNKTDDPRAWALSPGVWAALRTFKERYYPDAGPDDRVFLDSDGEQTPKNRMADLLREHLRMIGLATERPELFETTAQRHRMRVHDLRGTFVTIHLAAGKSESWIQDRTGHRSSNMIARYKRTAQTFAELQAGELAPLDQAIPELRAIAHGSPTEPGNGGVLREFSASGTVRKSVPALSQPCESAEMPQKPHDAGPPTEPMNTAPGQSGGQPDAVEAALAEALTRASAAGEWAVVQTLAGELEARRTARAGVVQLDAERARRHR